jgi:hypothetical protein
MTLRRQEGNGCKGLAICRVLLLVAVGSLLQVAACHAQATTERVVVDRLTGLAIDGFDPVAYFVDGAPRSGRESLEAVYDRAIWRFRNEGNRAAFLSHPEVYAPRFGGYDAVDVARGIAVEGSPYFWAVIEQRLFLFSNAASRDAFMQDGKLRHLAEQRWPQLRQGLSE